MSKSVNKMPGAGVNALRAVSALAIFAGVLMGCEGVVTGTEVMRVPLQAAEGVAGAYAPVKLNLRPDMNPVAINFRADLAQNPAEYGKWNTYRAALSKSGGVIVARTFNVNHAAASGPDSSSPPPTPTLHTLFIVDVQGAGEYELTITPVSPVAVTLNNAQIDARRNVQRPLQ
jgi:hypothetical protein